MENRGHGLLIKLSVAQFLAMLIWYNYSAVLPLLRAEWGLTDVMVGNILAVFQAGYVAMVLLTGWASDRWGARRVFVVSAIETGIFGCLFAILADGYFSALSLRALAGLGQGGLYVPGIRMLCTRYEGKQRNTAVAIYTAALVGAYAAAYFIAAPLAAVVGWRLSLLLTSVWAFVAAFIVWKLIPEEPKTASEMTSAQKGKVNLRNTAAWLIILGYCGHMWELYAFWGWIGGFFAAHYLTILGLEVTEALRLSGLAGGIVIMVGGVAPIIGSWLTNRTSFYFAVPVLALGSAVFSLVFGGLMSLPTTLLLTIAILYGILATADSSIYKTQLSVVVPPESLGTFLGIQSFTGFGVTIFSTSVFGIVLQKFGWGTAFGVLALGGVVASTSVAMAARAGGTR